MDEKYIKLLIKLSKKAAKTGNVPISAIIIKNNKIIAKAYNKKNKSNISIDHAEIIAIKKACKKLKSWRLNDCEMLVTLEPCKMCLYALAESRIKKVIYLVDSNYKETHNNNCNKILKEKCNNNEEYLKILNDFFKFVRNTDKN